MNNYLTYHEKVLRTSTEISSFSSEQNKEDNIDELLDTINLLKSNVINIIEKLNILSKTLRELTWYDDVSDEDLTISNSVFSKGNKLHSILIKRYVGIVNTCRPNGLLKKEIPLFKSAIDDFKESLIDFEDAILILPNDEEFQDITNQLLNL